MSVAILKLDEIGDFLLATGAIRLLAQAHGEENTVILVKSEIVPLARREFARADVVEIPWQPRRKGRNQAAANIRHCFPLWRRLRAVRVDLCVCLRSQRDYIQTMLFAAPRARRRVAPENVLLQGGKFRRRAAEALLRGLARPRLVPYPPVGQDLPTELASHRSVVAEALGREISVAEILPALVTVRWRGGEGWLVCPFSSRAAKDYSAQRWAQVLREAVARHAPRAIRLAGAADQSSRLQEFAAVLRSSGIDCPVEVNIAVSLENFPEAVAAADLVLTVDTAAAHFACATGAPAVIVASGLHHGTYGPYSTNGRQQWISGDWGGRGREGWQDSFPPGDVAEKIRAVLAA